MATGCPMRQAREAEHPCFGGDHRNTARMHLPVAPGCNIKCGFCERRFDCANESRPGVTSRVLSPTDALERVQQVIAHPTVGPKMKVIGIAGPGDPLANEKTFETFDLIKKAYPSLHLCLSTNGLLLPERMQEIIELGVRSLTVTVNALTPETGARVYEWVRYRGERFTGEEGAGLLLEHQLRGISMATQSGMQVKLNTVCIPNVNDHEVLDLAVKARSLGAVMMNIIPVIPLGIFKSVVPPKDFELDLLRNQAELILSQARHCQQCRADAVGMVGEDLDLSSLASA